MTSNPVYAQLAARVYAAKDENRIPVATGWNELEWMTLPLDCVSHNRDHELACLASHSLSNCIGLT